MPGLSPLSPFPPPPAALPTSAGLCFLHLPGWSCGPLSRALERPHPESPGRPLLRGWGGGAALPATLASRGLLTPCSAPASPASSSWALGSWAGQSPREGPAIPSHPSDPPSPSSGLNRTPAAAPAQAPEQGGAQPRGPVWQLSSSLSSGPVLPTRRCQTLGSEGVPPSEGRCVTGCVSTLCVPRLHLCL